MTDDEISERLLRVGARTEGALMALASGRLLERSIMLNRIGWELAKALDHVPEGAEVVEEGDIMDDLDELIGEVRQLRRSLALGLTTTGESPGRTRPMDVVPVQERLDLTEPGIFASLLPDLPWGVWVPYPNEAASVSGEAPYGDTFWPTLPEAVAFLARALANP